MTFCIIMYIVGLLFFICLIWTHWLWLIYSKLRCSSQQSSSSRHSPWKSAVCCSTVPASRFCPTGYRLNQWRGCHICHRQGIKCQWSKWADNKCNITAFLWFFVWGWSVSWRGTTQYTRWSKGKWDVRHLLTIQCNLLHYITTLSTLYKRNVLYIVYVLI